jgi:formylglycine-generating enzyme required for sulfatase activity
MREHGPRTTLQRATPWVAPIDGSAWMAGNCGAYIVRGGSWFDPPEVIRAANRYATFSDFRASTLSFRVGETLAP